MLEENKVHKETLLYSLIYGINPENINFENYFRFKDLLEPGRTLEIAF